MDERQVVKQIIEFNKTAFDNTFNVMVSMQDQSEKLFSGFFEKTPWFTKEGKKVFNDWVSQYKKGREDFKAMADENYKKVSSYFCQC